MAVMASDVIAWFRGIGAPAQRGQPAALAPWQATGPDAAGIGPVRADVRQERARAPSVAPPRVWFGSHSSAQRGEPAPLASQDHRPMETVQHPVSWGLPIYKYTRRYDRGSAAFSFDSGRVTYNPIGAGLVATRRLPVFSRLIGEVVPGQGIFWNTQRISAAGLAGPELGPLYSPQALYALLGPTLGQSVVNQSMAPGVARQVGG